MRLGLHLLSKAGNQFFGDPSAERDLQLNVMRQMKITDLKLVTDSDSQLKAATYLVQQGFRVIVRFYRPPVSLEAVPDDQLKLFRDVGVQAVEGYINEPEIEWGRPPVPEVIDDLARAYIKFADACGHVGIKPITPAIQGDRVYTWFEPFIARVVDLDRADALDGSIIGCHPRPANNLPDAAPPGFVARSYELFDDVVKKYLWYSHPIYATEFGYEPGDSQNKEQPRIDYANHAAYNVQLAQMTYRPCLEVGYYWTWLHDWSDSGWWRENVEASLPVVRSFIAMQKPVPPPPPPPPPPPADDDGAAWAQRGVPLNRDAAFYKEATRLDLGLPVTKEMDVNGTWRVQVFDQGTLYCVIGEWGDVKHVTW